MAVAKSTIISLTMSSVGNLIKWSSLASAANNVYFDVNPNIDTSKLIFLIAHTNSTDVGTTAGYFYFGSSASACSGTSYALEEFSARRLGRKLVKASPPTTDLTEGLTVSTAGAHIAISAFGPFESARLKDSQGYIKLSKRKASSDAGKVKVAAILLP